MAHSRSAGGGAPGAGGARRDPAGALAALGADGRDRQLLTIVLEQAPFGFALLDHELRYVHVNRYLSEINGVVAEEHIGSTVREIAPSVGDVVEPSLRRVLQTGDAVTEVTFTREGPAGPRHYHGSYHPVRGGAGEVVGVCVLVVDVTDRMRVADGLAVHAHRQTAVADLGQRALTHADVDTLLTDTVDVVERTLGVSHVAALELQPESSVLCVRAGTGWPADLTAFDATDDPAVNLFAFAIAAAAPVVVDDLDAEPVIAGVPALRDHHLASAAVVVIRGRTTPFGLLAAFSQRSHRFDDDDVAFLQSVANVVGAAVEQRRASEKLRATADQLQLALRAGALGFWDWDVRADRVTWSPTLAAIFGASADRTRKLGDYMAVVHPDDRADAEASVRAALEGTGGAYEHRIVRADGVVRWVHGVAHAQRDTRGRATRLIGLCADITERREAEESRMAALAAERAARAEAEEAGRRLAFLAEATARMVTSLDPPSTLETIAHLAVPVFADACVVTLDPGDEPAQAAVAARDPGIEALLAPLARRCPRSRAADSPHAVVRRTGRSLFHPRVPPGFVDDPALDEVDRSRLRALAVRSGMCVPLPARGQVLGTVLFARLGDAPPFSDTDVVLAEELARRAALAIDNARLFEEVQRTGERSRRLAETLQRSLLPPSLPDLPGIELAAAYHPAARAAGVGGDFYDVFPLGGGRWGVVIGDVCGKGPDAAALTALARYTIRTVALTEDAPRTALVALNDVILHGAEEGQYCTVAYARLCPRTGELTIACGGHPLPLVRRTTGRVEPIGAPGTLIGLFEHPEITERTVTLALGDAVLFFTDGVTDVRRGSEIYGDERLVETLRTCGVSAAHDLVRCVERHVLDFGGERARDDLAMLVLRMVGGWAGDAPGTLR